MTSCRIVSRPITSLSSKSEKRRMYSYVVYRDKPLSIARHGSTKATINVRSASRGEFELFYTLDGWLASGGKGTLVAMHYGVYVPRLFARSRDCIIDIRPTPVPLTAHQLCTSEVIDKVCLKKIIWMNIYRWNNCILRSRKNSANKFTCLKTKVYVPTENHWYTNIFEIFHIYRDIV